jgi:hypothetical protein
MHSAKAQAGVGGGHSRLRDLPSRSARASLSGPCQLLDPYELFAAELSRRSTASDLDTAPPEPRPQLRNSSSRPALECLTDLDDT